MSHFIPSEIRVSDVTNDVPSLLTTYRMIAHSYASLSSQMLDADQIIQELCRDQFTDRECTRTLLATTQDTNTGLVAPLGTIRIVFVGNTNISSNSCLELMTLMNCDSGWDSIGIDITKSTEIGRLAFTHELDPNRPRDVALMARITHCLVKEATDLATRELQRRQIWGIMSNTAIKLFRIAKTDWTPVASVSPNYVLNSAMFERFDRYWIDGRPQLYRYGGLI